MHEHAAALLRPGLFNAPRYGFAGNGRRQRHGAAGERLAETEDIRLEARPFRGEHLAGTPKSCGDFINDQQQFVLVAQLPQPAQVVGVIEPHPARALHDGFEDDRRQPLRVALDGVAHGPEAVGIERAVETAAWALDEQVFRQDAGKQRMHTVYGIADGHGPLRVAVVAALGGEEAGFARPAL